VLKPSTHTPANLLPLKQREALHPRYFAGVDFAEKAAAMDG